MALALEVMNSNAIIPSLVTSLKVMDGCRSFCTAEIIFVLNCAVLCCVVLCCVVLYCIVLYSIVL